MKDDARFPVEIRDVAPGLWIWRLRNRQWHEGADWEPVVTCTFVESAGERLVLDPLAPPDDAIEVWKRLDDRPPTGAVVLAPDHVRDVDTFVERYRIPAFGPSQFDPGDAPKTDMIPVLPGAVLPGGLIAYEDPRGWSETPLWLPEQRVLVFADGLTERGGELRVWMSPTHDERALPVLRRLLNLPFDHVIISHGEPIHTHADYELALKRPPWPASQLHIAAYLGRLEVVRRLVEEGADLRARDERYQATPLEWARMNNQHQIIAYLEEVGKE
jgi:Ankyrin repeats (many copies)